MNRRRGTKRKYGPEPPYYPGGPTVLQPMPQPAPFHVFAGGGALSRTALHQQWNQAAHQNSIHFDLGQGGFQPNQPNNYLRGLNFADIDLIPTPSDRPGQDTNEGLRTWDINPYGDPIALAPLPNQQNWFQINAFRLAEIGALIQRGGVLYNNANISLEDHITLNQLTAGGGQRYMFEPRWAFKGMADETTGIQVGPAYSTFEYIISDLIQSHATGADLCSTIKDILCDVVNLATPHVGRHTRVIFYFQGEWPNQDVGHHGKPWFYFNHKGWTVGDAFDYPESIIAEFASTLSRFEDSDHFKCFQFYRVFVCCLTSLNLLGGGGSLKQMPPELVHIRESKEYKGKKGYIAIENDDMLCGLYAFMAGFGNVCGRIKKAYKVLNARAPDICEKLNKFGTKIKNQSRSAKQIQAELLLEMTSSVGWKQGEPITPQQLCLITTHVRDKYQVDIGLLIFDAVYPLKNIIISYNPEEKIPTEKICLIHWNYGDNDLHGGHYDCIYATNLVSWIQKGIANRQNLVFCYRSLRLVRNNETNEKGPLCTNCGFYQKEIELRMGRWEDHGLVSSFNQVSCTECKGKFRSNACYQQHLQKPHGLSKAACESRRLCPSCSKIHGSEYDCATFFCWTCKKRLPTKERNSHICYIQNSAIKFQNKVEHVVYADCEGNRLKGYHSAVCIAVAWDELCKDHRKLLKKRCEVCKLGNQRLGAFCTGCMDDHGITLCPSCYKRKSKFFIDDSPVDIFLAWLEKKFKKVTVVFHNGGRYDMHLIYSELLKSGRYYIKKEAERGTQIIFMVASLLSEERRKKTTEIRFIDSFNFITAALRSFPNMFNIDKGLLTKGRFPYELLNTPDWKEYRGACPGPEAFGITPKELKSIDGLSKNRGKEIKEILQYIEEQNDSKEEWIAKDKIRDYTLLDVFVLHAGCEDFRKNFWNVGHTDPFHWVTLAAAVAGTYRQPIFMEPDSIQVFGMEEREWQRRGLRGGRCEPFKLYWKASNDQEELKVYDVNSEYPAAQMYAFMPYGEISFEKKYVDPISFSAFLISIDKEYKINVLSAFKDPTGSQGNGIIECYIESAFSHFPILPYKDEKQGKNMFMSRKGMWHGFLCVLAEAIAHNQIIVTHIKRIQFWKQTTNQLFQQFIGTLYARKVECTGWSKILNEEKPHQERMDEFVEECHARHIPIKANDVRDNQGLRSTSKMMANCGWGYMCQRPHAGDILYFNNDSYDEVEEMSNLLINLNSAEDPRRLTNFPQGIANFTRIKLTKDPINITKKEMNNNIAYHVGGIAPAWGLQLLGRTLLTLHPSQPVYCDTDSVFFVYDKSKIEKGTHQDIKRGQYLGDFMDEYPEYRIVEFVSIGCKSYFMKMIHRKTGAVEYKGKFKGLPMLSSSHSLLNEEGEIASFGMEQMKKILFSAYNPDEKEGDYKVDSIKMKFLYKNYFKRNQDMKIREVDETKTIQFTFDKRKVLWPQTGTPETWNEINTLPFCDETELDQSMVRDFWDGTSKIFFNK